MPSESNTAIRKAPIVADRILLDLIERLEDVRAQLEKQDTDGVNLTHFPMLTDNALCAAIDYLIELREARHAGIDHV